MNTKTRVICYKQVGQPGDPGAGWVVEADDVQWFATHHEAMVHVRSLIDSAPVTFTPPAVADPKCDGQWAGCLGGGEHITHIDRKGYAYCTPCGEYRRETQACRKLRKHEIARIRRGEQLGSY